MLAHAAADFFAYGAYGRLLIIAVGDLVVYADVFKRQPGRAPFDDFFQIGLAEKEACLPLGAALVVPEKGIEAVGREHDGALPETAFEAVGVELGLRSSGIGILAGLFCFHHGERLAIFAPENIIRIALLPGNVGHALHFVFLRNVAVRPFQFPVHAEEHGVDINLACLELGKVFQGEGAALAVVFLLFGVFVCQ